jgi:hypothetical protein
MQRCINSVRSSSCTSFFAFMGQYLRPVACTNTDPRHDVPMQSHELYIHIITRHFASASIPDGTTEFLQFT